MESSHAARERRGQSPRRRDAEGSRLGSLWPRGAAATTVPGDGFERRAAADHQNRLDRLCDLKDGTKIFYKDWGARACSRPHRVPSRLALSAARLGHEDAVIPVPWLRVVAHTGRGKRVRSTQTYRQRDGILFRPMSRRVVDNIEAQGTMSFGTLDRRRRRSRRYVAQHEGNTEACQAVIDLAPLPHLVKREKTRVARPSKEFDGFAERASQTARSLPRAYERAVSPASIGPERKSARV